MANQTGQRSTFNDTVGLKIDLSDAMPFIVTPDDTPLWSRFAHKQPTMNAVLHQWLEDTLPPSADVLGAMYTSGAGTMVVTDFTVFKAGYVLKIESELFRVTTTPTTTTVTVVGAYAGSTAANHANTTAITIIGYAVTDGADPEQFATSNRTTASNLMQVFQEKIEVTDLNEWQQNYGVQDKYGYEVKKWLRVLAIRAEKTLIHGLSNTDATNKTRTMAGLLALITTNKTNVAGALTETAINNEIQDCYDNGGQPNLLVMPPKQKRVLTGLMASTQKYYPRPNDNEALGAAVTQYISDFGTLDVLVDRHLPSDTVLVLDTSLIRIVDGQPFTLENLARTGTARKGQIVGWFTLELVAEKRHSYMSGLT